MQTLPITERHMLPRWRAFKDALALGELCPQQAPLQPQGIPQSLLQEKLDDWVTNKTLSFATELVEAAIFSSQPEVATNAASFILEAESSASESAKYLANKLLILGQAHDVDPQNIDVSPLSFYFKVAFLKGRVRQNPRNPFAWADLAFYYGNVGLLTQAEKALKIGLALAPESRFLIRSLVRVYTHAGNLDCALALLRSRRLLKIDPWIMSAEIAVADLSDKPSVIITEGLRTLKSNRFHPYHVSELACSIATLEIQNGANKKARKLFSSGMLSPTENSCAQFEWAIKNSVISRPNGIVCEVPGNFEAKSYAKYSGGEWEKSLKYGWMWCLDQPFSIEATSWGSYIASIILSDYRKAIQIAEIGLMANPQSWLLKNNLAFSLAKNGQADSAAKILKNCLHPKDDDNAIATLLATRGLVSYRQGDLASGRAFYEQGIQIFANNEDYRSIFIALTIWVIEEIKNGSKNIESMIEEIKDIARKIPKLPEAQALLSKIDSQLNIGGEVPYPNGRETGESRNSRP